MRLTRPVHLGLAWLAWGVTRLGRAVLTFGERFSSVQLCSDTMKANSPISLLKSVVLILTQRPASVLAFLLFAPIGSAVANSTYRLVLCRKTC